MKLLLQKSPNSDFNYKSMVFHWKHIEGINKGGLKKSIYPQICFWKQSGNDKSSRKPRN